MSKETPKKELLANYKWSQTPGPPRECDTSDHFGKVREVMGRLSKNVRMPFHFIKEVIFEYLAQVNRDYCLGAVMIYVAIW